MFEIKNVRDVNGWTKGIECAVGLRELCFIECLESSRENLFSVLCGYEKIVYGEGYLLEMKWFNCPLDVKAIQFRRFAGIVSKQFGLLDFFTCKKNIMISGLLDNDVGYDYLYNQYEEIFRIKKLSNKFPRELSKKEIILIKLARSFWNNKKLVIIDGIFDELNETDRIELIMVLKIAIKKLDTSVICLTSLCGFDFGADKKYLFSDGKLIRQKVISSI